MKAAEIESSESLGRPVDLAHLSVYTLGNRALESELFGIFRSQAQIYLNTLETAGTDKEWRDAAHGLKGSARSLGAWELGQCAEEAENMPGPEAQDSDQVLGRIRTAIARVNLFIDSLLLS